jgi:UDP-N-acetylmuramoyl-L-alanyl-D-glutamate--2,6-diaminopimelate ligase
MELKEILYKVRLEETNGLMNTDISGIAFDSRKVKPNFVFVAIKGLTVDGHEFIPIAIQNGAKAIILESSLDTSMLDAYPNLAFVRVANSEGL